MIYDDNGGMLPKLYEDVLHTTTIHTNLFNLSKNIALSWEITAYHIEMDLLWGK